ncbi:MAG: diguanylate cyclase [Azoarcus sp.]|nr:diguanylate cyclase [Azoarcus sp.]
MNLKPRFLILTAALILLASTAAWFAFERIAEGIIEQWGVRLAETQVRYDSARLLQPLSREIALSKQMANSQVIRRWAVNPNDAALEREAIAEMESFRSNFQDGSYFVALKESGAYYHNNDKDEFAGQQLRYHLKPENPADRWFYQIVEQGRDFHLNVNPDEQLGVTKLWIDVVIRDGDRILGVVGTGLELDRFIREVVRVAQPGITTLFADHNGAIQLYRDPRYIDFATIVKREGEKNTIDRLLDSETDRQHMRLAMQALASEGPAGASDARVLSHFVKVEGKRYLAGVAYLPEIDWYEVTLLDLGVLMPVHSFASVLFIFATTLLAALLLFNYVLNRLVLNPVAALETAMLRVSDGDLTQASLPRGQGEIGRLIARFGAMAESVRNHTRDLEARVAERTEALHRLASIDALTGLLNRRGLSERLTEEISRAQREQHTFGLLWIDIDLFKEINDYQGHAVGDEALAAVGRLLACSIRPYDCAARWGGDEFLVLLSPCDHEALARLGERIRAGVEAGIELPGETGVTVSIGACLAGPGESLETILHRADQALYAAKAEGRNRLCIAGDRSEEMA